MTIIIDGTGTITGATTLASTVASPTFTTPALGIPASGTLTNCTGLPVAGGGTGLTALGPAFSAYLSANQSFSSATWTKVQCNTEEFDTNSNYDPTTNYRFTPTVAGYYQVQAFSEISYGAGAPTTRGVSIYKNGASFKQLTESGSNAYSGTPVVALMLMNGSSDYIEMYAYSNASTPVAIGDAAKTFFQASLARPA